MTDDSTPNVPRNRRTLRLLAAGGATAVLLAGGSVAAFAAAGTPTGTPKPSATATPGAPGQPGPNGGARPSPPVHKPHLTGTVTAVSGSTITITDRDGFSREIKVTGSTTYADGLTAIPQGRRQGPRRGHRGQRQDLAGRHHGQADDRSHTASAPRPRRAWTPRSGRTRWSRRCGWPRWARRASPGRHGDPTAERLGHPEPGSQTLNRTHV